MTRPSEVSLVVLDVDGVLTDGRLLASSSYAVDETFGLSRWASTRAKVAVVVKALITGFES